MCGEVAAEGAPEGAVARAADGAGVVAEKADERREGRPVGEDGSAADEHLVDHLPIGDDEDLVGAELDRHERAVLAPEILERGLDIGHGAGEPEEISDYGKGWGPGR